MCITVCVQLDILEYIHANEYTHADIKASNLLIGYTDPQQVSLYVRLLRISFLTKNWPSDENIDF